ncbi:hypothetical protein [Cohnella fermenti]|uniref:histidine kinase n=1 Tax=Cohnella fermenti TaxID=2565925 RepID=A0A4S4C3U1_9BACL|nr:hypothetical protein [Cohnella fermenti]THF82183.1 hypothetical protein E6C55_07300 [Cohnella fermenti]
MEAAQEQMIRHQQERTEMLQSISHDIRTPPGTAAAFVRRAAWAKAAGSSWRCSSMLLVDAAH